MSREQTQLHGICTTLMLADDGGRLIALRAQTYYQSHWYVVGHLGSILALGLFYLLPAQPNILCSDYGVVLLVYYIFFLIMKIEVC